MSIGLGIFASVVLILAVYHAGFRKVLLRTAAVVVALALVSAAAYFGYDRYMTWKADRVAARAKATLEAAKHDGIMRCMSRLGTPLATDAPKTLPAAYFNNLHACVVAPDDYDPFAEIGGRIDRESQERSLPDGYTLDQSGRVVRGINLSAGFVPKPNSTHATSCPNDLPVGYKLDQPCILSSTIIDGFRPEMCVGTIQSNGDCVTETPAGARVKGFGQLVQLCPYGLPINASHECPSWKDVDVKKEEQKLLKYRKR